MRPLHAIVLAALLPITAAAEGSPADTTTYGPIPADQVVFADQMFVKRPLVVFADTPNDPNFIRQIDLISGALSVLEERDVVIVVDTDPEARSEWRQKLRPRGFSLVIMDKDLKPVVRKPNPWTVREIVAAIDKLPLRRQEVLELNPAGR
jgi:hypothetical protein